MDSVTKQTPIYKPGMDERSTRVAERMATPMLVAAALVIPSVALSESHPGGALGTIALALNWITYLAFLAELLVMLAVVPDRRTWLRHNPLDLVICILTPPILPAGLQSLRALRLLRLVRLLRLAQLSREVFSLRGLRYSALLALLTVIGGGAVFGAFEKHSQDLTFWQTTYWAITTMTTLGSNIYPTTTGGQIVSTCILLIGIAFVALLTGGFAQRFLAPDLTQIEEELGDGEIPPEELALRELRNVQEQLQSLQLAVEALARQRERAEVASGRTGPG
ncbi:MAG: two pore domain potassium channel family protein [Actinobacteria bacterium]|nr:two pore domain potassium channel family protein [Actinomycetota bacterium]